ncbi:unnamed protein product, partial [Brassica oleracea]
MASDEGQNILLLSCVIGVQPVWCMNIFSPLRNAFVT